MLSTLPLLDPVAATGLTAAELEQRLAALLNDGVIKNPQVSVLVKEQVSKKVYVLGQVSRPGTLTFTPSMSVVEAITNAGGFTPLAAKNDTSITRNELGKKTIFNFARHRRIEHYGLITSRVGAVPPPET